MTHVPGPPLFSIYRIVDRNSIPGDDQIARQGEALPVGQQVERLEKPSAVGLAQEPVAPDGGTDLDRDARRNGACAPQKASLSRALPVKTVTSTRLATRGRSARAK
jgi:hypothetical protein